MKHTNILITVANVKGVEREKGKGYAEQVRIYFTDGSQITVFDPSYVLKVKGGE